MTARRSIKKIVIAAVVAAAVIALGYLRRECWEVGTQIQVGLTAGGAAAVHVVELPFYARPS